MNSLYEHLYTSPNNIYAHLAKNRVIFINEDLNKEVAATLCGLLLYYDNESNDMITINIHTNGGDTDALACVYDTMQMIKSPIRTVCIGKAYSAGAFILAAGTKGERYIFPNANVMIHGMQCVFPLPSFADQKDSEILLKFLKYSNDKILSILAKHTSQPIEKIRSDAKRDLFLNAKEAVAYGVADQIVSQ